MHRLPPALAAAALIGLTACVPTTPPTATCTDPNGAVYVQPAGGCPAFVASPPAKAVAAPKKRAVAVPKKPTAIPVSGGDGGGNSSGGWG